MLIMNVKNNRVLLDLTFYKVLALLICQLDFSCTEQVTNKPRNFDYEQPLQQSSEIDNITESNETLSALETQNNKKQIEEINTTDNLTVTSNVSEKYDNLNQSNDTTTKNHIDSNINITNQIKETTKSDMTSQTPLSTKQTTEKNEILKRNHVTKQIKEITKSDMTSQNPLSTKQTTEKMEILKQNHINSTLNNIYKTVNDTNENKLLVIKGNKISYNINDIKGENNITEMKVNKSPTTEKISIQQSYHLTKSHSYNSKNNNNKEIPKNEVIGEKQPKKNILDILLNKNFNTTQQTLLKPEFRSIESPSDKVDTILDGEVDTKDICRALEKKDSPIPIWTPNDSAKSLVPNRDTFSFSSGRSVVTRFVRRADGSTEREEIVKDSDGTETKTVTRSLGDHEYSVTTIKDALGVEKRTENYKNIDPGRLEEFNKAWDIHGSKWWSWWSDRKPGF